MGWMSRAKSTFPAAGSAAGFCARRVACDTARATMPSKTTPVNKDLLNFVKHIIRKVFALDFLTFSFSLIPYRPCPR